MIRIEWRAWTVLAPYLILIDVPTGILIDYRSKDITLAIGSVSSPSFTGTHIIFSLIITMSTVFTSIFNNEARAEGSRSVCAARGRGRHNSMLDHVQSRAACCVSVRREVTPFDFNIGQYQVSLLFRCRVVTVRLIYNLRSLGLKKGFLILMRTSSTSGLQRLGLRRRSRICTRTTLFGQPVVLLGGS